MLRNRPPVAIFVFSLLQMITPISWWCTPPGSEKCTQRQASTHAACSCTPKNSPFCKSTIWTVAWAACFYSHSYSSLSSLRESLLLKIFIPFFPSYFSTNFLSGEQFLEPFLLSLSLQLSLFCSLLCGLFCLPLQTSAFCCCYLGQFASGVSPQLFLYLFFPPKTKGGYIYS